MYRAVPDNDLCSSEDHYAVEERRIAEVLERRIVSTRGHRHNFVHTQAAYKLNGHSTRCGTG